MFNLIYVERDDSDITYRIFQYLLEACSEQLAGKTIRWLYDYMIIMGYMPSGSLETSMGDTWIMMIFYWLSYLFFEMRQATREVRRKIWRFLKIRFIIGLFFGDDFLIAFPLELLDAPLSVDRFAEYLLRNHNVRMKSRATHFSLLTYLNVTNNEVTGYAYRGPVYLKRRFIDSRNFMLKDWEPEIADVVPWRALQQYQWRAGVPTDRTNPVFMNLPRLLGLIYDTLGVDPVAYHMLAYMYKVTYQLGVKMTSEQYIRTNMPEWVEKDKKYLLKIGYEIHDKIDCPTRGEMLKLNIFDREYHKPRFPTIRSWQESMLDSDFAF